MSVAAWGWEVVVRLWRVARLSWCLEGESNLICELKAELHVKWNEVTHGPTTALASPLWRLATTGC